MYSNPRNEREVMEAWERLLRGDGPQPGPPLRSLVDGSWQRCHSARVDPHRRTGPQPISATDLVLRMERQRDLLDASVPVMAHARDFLAQTGTFMALADADSTILSIEGDVPAIHSAETINLMPGVGWQESVCGTNAIGTALAIGSPVQVHSAEHFCEGIKRWTCSAAVIRHPSDGEIVGVIDVSGLSPTFSRQTLALAVNSAGRIENQLTVVELERRFRLIDLAIPRLARAGQDGAIVLDRRGCPVQFNEQASAALRALAPTLDLRQLRVLPELSVRRLGRRPLPERLPAWLDPAWVEPLVIAGEHLGTLLVIPADRSRQTFAAVAAVASAERPAGQTSLPEPSADAVPMAVAPIAVAVTAVEAAAAVAARGAGFERLVTASSAMQTLVDKARQLRRSQVPVLVLGETGVGKEEIARGLHAGGPFVVVNCGALSRELLASELFGYVDGAFTGARKGGMIGKIEAANNGTLFLDEIGEMPIDMQAHLLRVLEQREICRLGEYTPRKVSFRLLAATNRDLRAEIEAQRFRMDLYYRLAVAVLQMPPLRERGEDIRLLARHFWDQLRADQGLAPGQIEPAAEAALLAYPWPGNVRELRNVLEGCLSVWPEPVLRHEALPEFVTRPDATGSPAPASTSAEAASVASGWGEYDRAPGDEAVDLTAAEARTIRRVLQACAGNRTQAARRLGIAKSTLYAKLKRHGIAVN